MVLQSKGQWFDPGPVTQKNVNLDENSWTPTKIIKREALVKHKNTDEGEMITPA